MLFGEMDAFAGNGYLSYGFPKTFFEFSGGLDPGLTLELDFLRVATITLLAVAVWGRKTFCCSFFLDGCDLKVNFFRMANVIGTSLKAKQ
jgi:hypothetical protein